MGCEQGVSMKLDDLFKGIGVVFFFMGAIWFAIHMTAGL